MWDGGALGAGGGTVDPTVKDRDTSGFERFLTVWVGLAITLVVNWLINPFSMAALAVLFFEGVFADLIAPADAQ